MPCELHDEAWLALLAAGRLLADGPRDLAFCERDGEWHCEPVRADRTAVAAEQVLFVAADTGTDEESTFDAGAATRVTVYRPRERVPELTDLTTAGVDARMQSFARVYLPIVHGAARARTTDRVFVAAHVTQTLDGRIACTNGQSQWIGNEADLQHAHRMRALLDGVAVGANTVLQDDPKLTVRHVEGPDPKRLVISGTGRALAGEEHRQVFDAPGSIVLVRDDVTATAPTSHVELVPVERNCRDDLSPAAILAAIKAQGVHSIYLEGGARTVSSFLATGAIDLLQVHVASMVLGSGLSSFELPTVEHVRDGRPFVMDHASLQGHLLLTCWPQPRD
ncbi:MAG: RibD family protein [bacterium]|nr:RibD family protein [bacterium]